MLFSLTVSAILFTGVLSATISSSPAQTFRGVGGSGAWWPYDLYNFPEATRANLSNLLFTDSGLGLSSFRYNVGAGGVNVSNPVRAPQTFFVSTGTYDWTRDPQGRYFLQAAATRGVPLLTAFANSAPPSMTAGGASCNSDFKSGQGTAYGTYLTDVISHFRDSGINITLVSPMNEPDSSFGPSPCGQEGMSVPASSRAEVINGLYSALTTKGLQNTVGILADESSQLAYGTSHYSTWLPSVVSKVKAIVHHTYDFPSDATYRSYIQTVNSAYPGKETWMSEVCCSGGQANGTGRGWAQGYDPTITNALVFSGLVLQAFNVAQEPHYDFWTLVSSQLGCSPTSSSTCATTANSNGWNDGVIYYDPSYATNKNYNLYVKKQFWTYKHFGNFIKPGSQRFVITGSDATNNTLAVRSADSTTWTIIAMNPDSSSKTLSLTFPLSVTASEGHRTSASEDFVSLSTSTLTKSGNTYSIPLSATSLTSWRFK